jgi:V8-like Glu-specific endopeptidase
MRHICILSLLFALGACSSSKTTEGNLDCGDEKTARSPIINGDPIWDPSVITITENQAKAVGFLELGGVGGCTGTLIAPRIVLTAAHCVYSRPRYVRFYVGDNYVTPEGVYDATSYQAHPYYGGGYVDFDIAIVELATDPMAAGVQPIPAHLEPPQTLAGQDVQAVGFGITRAGTGGNTRKWWTVLRVTREVPTIFQVTGLHDNGTCQGDSGGPLLWHDPELGTRVHGALSSGDSSDCLGNSFYPRTDTPDNAAFIRTYIPEDLCEGETLEGRCDGNTAIYCEADAIVVDTCDAWEACQLDAEGHYRCVVTDPCRGETFEGRCDDAGAAIWCEDEDILVHGCPDFGYWCGMNDDGLYRCLPPGPCQAEGLDWNGVCTEDGHVRWCEDGQVKDRDCWLCNQDCGWAGDTLGNYCLDR